MTSNCYFQTSYCVKSVQIRSFFWSVFSRIQSEYGKIRTGKNSVFGHFSRSVKLSSLYCGYVLERNKQKKKEYFFILIVSCLNSDHQNTQKKTIQSYKIPKILYWKLSSLVSAYVKYWQCYNGGSSLMKKSKKAVFFPISMTDYETTARKSLLNPGMFCFY